MPSDLVTLTTLTAARKAVSRSLPSVATITRTGAVYPCRVAKWSGRVWRPAGDPSYTGVPFWKLVFNVAGTDVIVADKVTVPTKGTYIVTYTDAPEDYDIQITARCIRSEDLAGNDLWSIVTTDTVTFSKDTYPANPVPTTAPTAVRIYPVREQWNLQQFWTDFQWAIDFQPTVRYQAPYATLQVTVGDTLHWTRASDGKVLTPKLEHPMTNNDPVMPVVTALFKELF